MSKHETRIARDLLAEPHVQGRRIPVLTLVERVEGRGLAPQTVAERHDLDVATVYAALLYYHDHREDFDDLQDERAAIVERVESDLDRPADVDPSTS